LEEQRHQQLAVELPAEQQEPLTPPEAAGPLSALLPQATLLLPPLPACWLQ
jgi:hypothetical protein